MKRMFVVLLVFAGACSSDPRTRKEQTTDVMEAATRVSTNEPDTLCFIRTEGIQNEDTIAVKLIITADKVEGKMMSLPFEKDQRLGNLYGVRTGDFITANWKYLQEGLVDSIPVAFRLEGERLMQKASIIDEATGREVLPENAAYRILFHKIDCISFPQEDFDLGMIQ